MDRHYKIMYHYHCGFSVQVGSTLFIFDYWEGDDRSLSPSGKITPSILQAYERIYVFVSHDRGHHFDPIIYTWIKDYPKLPITYVVANDVLIGTKGKRLAPLKRLQLSPDISVTAFGSTAHGVSLLVKVDGLHIFHAGNLNFWHWQSVNSARRIEEAERKFEACLLPITKEQIDIAFFPVDPRLGNMCDAGATRFIFEVKPRLFLPMHFQDRAEVAVDFARRNKTAFTETLALTTPGVMATVTTDYTGKLVSIHIVDPPKELPRPPVIQKESLLFNEQDPFINSDQPVKFN